jgi:2-polyprenyl-6-methoxyphenol hydroxylase-like FAD-dependent oxidoreductase
MVRDLSDLPYGGLGIPQYATEAILEAHLASYGVVVERGVTFAGLQQSEGEVLVSLERPAGRTVANFSHVVGCDGAHSAVRKALDIDFEGEAFPWDFMLGDVRIDWDLPRGFSLRAIKPAEGGPPDIFVAVPLPERGRYRVSMLAPERLRAPGGTEHGIQSDRPGATLADLQEVADRLIPDPPKLTGMRWSSIFRISMRLAATYRVGNAFIAGDACHIHPPTGGQGMNTGIQDAYNLAWKLALVSRGRASDGLLDSYEAERRPVAMDVIERTTQASVNLGSEDTKTDQRLEDTQVLVAYTNGPLSIGPDGDDVVAGDRCPDAQGLRRSGFGFPLRLFDVLKGTNFVLLITAQAGDIGSIERLGENLRERFGGVVRVVAILPAGTSVADPFGITIIRDEAGDFAATLGGQEAEAWLVRPDGYVGLYMPSWSEGEVVSYLTRNVRLKT